MDRTLLWIAAVTGLGYALAWSKAPSDALDAARSSVAMLGQSLPWIVVSMFLAGLVSQWLQPEMVARWLGREAGLFGMVLGALIGMLGTGSRFAVYPLAVSLLAADASPGAVVAFTTSWQLTSLARLPAEFPFFGMPFALVRFAISFVISVAGGVLFEWLWRILSHFR
ncbi:permease [Alicyclobacillus vulcanalis]|uniref:Predicted permease n=1 Tax=Alicyclobacillus vulcanalis TaxID=252246 RepID=A0A1N7KMN9_9BACL|nr:permease [Alicyclobacillus vulcanalis]SIS62720.1 Predicted permease [Alicyclobacillus vulcanalis]